MFLGGEEYSRPRRNVNRSGGEVTLLSGESDTLLSGSPPEWKKHGTRGGASSVLLIVLVLVGLAGLLAAVLVMRGDSGDTTEPLRLEQSSSGGVSTGRPSFTLAQDQAPKARSLEEQQAELKPAVFDGKGTIAGHVFPAPGSKMPDNWTLIIEPSPYLVGKELAVRRVFERTADDAEFEVKGLPHAGYRVRATAPGMNSSEVNILIARGVERQYVNLKLKPSGFIDGGVTNSRSEPLDGVRVVLESAATNLRVETVTDQAGNYIFRDVLDGKYTLTFGSPDDPLIPAQTVIFKAPSLRFPTRVIESDATAALTVIDVGGSAIADAKVQGFGPSGGAFAGTTDSQGRAEFRFLPAGDYTIVATSDDRRGRGRFKLVAHEISQITLKIED